MSERDDENEKITVLFPKSQTEDESSEGEAAPSTPEPEDLTEDDDGQDNVVRLDFRRDDTRRSPRPEKESVEAPSPQNQTKLDIFSRIIEEGMVMVTLDTRLEGVEVPPKFRGLPELRLNFSHLFHLPDFEYDGHGVQASLSFQGQRHFCQVPWTAVFMLYSHETGEVFVFEPSEN